MIRTLVEPNPVLTDASRDYVLNLMENITPSQDWGATGGVPTGVTVALKNGFAVIDQVADQHHRMGQWRRPRTIHRRAHQRGASRYGDDTVNAVSGLVWNSLGPTR